MTPWVMDADRPRCHGLAMTTETLTPAIPTAQSDVPAVGTGEPPWAALPVIVGGALMVVLDFFILNVALPSLATDLRASPAQLEWIVASYALLEGILLITAGRLGDNFGRRRLYFEGVALFTVASLACGLAPTVTVLIIARLAQGVAGAMLMPQVLAIIGVSFHGADRVKAMGFYSAGMGLVALCAQLIGGALVQWNLGGSSWRACFLINVPIGLVLLALTSRLVPESRAARPGRVDARGMLLLTTGLTAIALPLIEGRAHGWPAWTWISFAAAPVLLAAFIAHQLALSRRGLTPLLDLALFSNRRFSAGLLTQLLFWSGQAAFFLYFALYLQRGRGLSPLQAGLVFTIAAAAYVTAAAITPAAMERYGRRVILIGGLTLAAGHGLLAIAVSDYGVHGSTWVLLPGLLAVGVGMGLCLTAIAATVLETFDDERAGSASGVVGTVQGIGNSFGVAITGVVFFDALHGGFGHAFSASEAQLTCTGLAIAALSLLLPAALARPKP
ncbi:MAG: MFS transporter [Actinomycetota bacterium]|nr:MFS transporter [Actinomycetota bacterium]